MTNQDTISLLQECDAGARMAVSSINEVLDKVSDTNLKHLLAASREHHEQLGDEIHAMLSGHHSETKEPAPLAKGMSWLKTNVKMGLDESDATAADLITDGCSMGVKTLHRYLNQYKEADAASKGLCMRLAAIEEQLCSDLRSYL